MFVLDVRVCHSEEFSDEVAARDVVPPRPRAREPRGPDKILFQLSLLSLLSSVSLLEGKISSFLLLVTGPSIPYGLEHPVNDHFLNIRIFHIHSVPYSNIEYIRI